MARIDQTLSALADPTRRKLLKRLAAAPCRAGALARGFKISRPAICKHTRRLQRAGLVTATRNGRERIYRLAPEGGARIRQMLAELEQLGRFWDAVLKAFKRYAEEHS